MQIPGPFPALSTKLALSGDHRCLQLNGIFRWFLNISSLNLIILGIFQAIHSYSLLSITKIEFWEMKITMSKQKITLDGINNKLDIIFQN